jgi:hypothetical protein
MDSPLSPDPEGIAAYQLGRILNELYFLFIQSFLMNARNCPLLQHEKKAKGKALGLTERIATRDRDRLKRRISAYCEKWFNYLRSEEYVEDWHCTIDEYRAEGTPLSHSPERSRDEFCHDWTRSAEVDFDYFLDRIGRCLSKELSHLLRLGVQLDSGIRPRCVWRGMGVQQPIDAVKIGLRKLERPCVRYCPTDGSIEPDLVWRDELIELLHHSPYVRLRSIELRDAVAKVEVEQLDADIQRALTSEMQPNWDPTTRRLYYGRVIVKDWKRHPAPDQEQLVETFCRGEWKAVSNPFSDVQKLRTTVANFNRTAKGLHFIIRDSGDSVAWEQKSPPAGS